MGGVRPARWMDAGQMPRMMAHPTHLWPHKMAVLHEGAQCLRGQAQHALGDRPPRRRRLGGDVHETREARLRVHVRRVRRQRAHRSRSRGRDVRAPRQCRQGAASRHAPQDGHRRGRPVSRRRTGRTERMEKMRLVNKHSGTEARRHDTRTHTLALTAAGVQGRPWPWSRPPPAPWRWRAGASPRARTW